MRLTPSYAFAVISACAHPCHTNTFTRRPHKNTFIATENTFLNRVLLKSKIFPFMHMINFNPKVLYKYTHI